MQRVVFTDLDGTLIDHDTYQAGPAADALHALLDHEVIVIFCSAKTLVEQQALADELDVSVGFITENGAEVLLPDGRHHRFGRGYQVVRQTLIEARDRLSLAATGYGDVTDEVVAQATGLSPEAAARARKRSHTETILDLDAGNAPSLAAALASQDLRLQEGSRFWSVQGDHDKGTTVRWTLAHLSEGEEYRSFGIGDGPNDLEMLAEVDHPLLVRQPGGAWAEMPIEGIRRLDGVGPLGWVEAAQIVLDRADSR